ncbi:MAG: esterase family protein [Defluviitaleaceae bacterium]|nr:esterase family protein [Defluviitaleaceae bacterium]MCL2835219.1 esterase family protein [Defluviitaleaceae bacterium]
MAFMTCSFYSKALNSHTNMNVIIPEDINGGEYPVLYLLHGYSGDFNSWARSTSLPRYAEEYKLAVIMPDCNNSFYNDFPGIENGYRYWTFVSVELIEVTRALFKLSRKYEDTFVAGLSMGGFGAFKCALNRPDLFSVAGSLSGALDLVNLFAGTEDMKNEIKMVAGGVDAIKGSANDLFAAAERTARLRQKPRLYQFCGTDDFLFEGNVRFRDFVQDLGYNLTYEESPGGHEWALWDVYIKRFIDTLGLEPGMIRRI